MGYRFPKTTADAFLKGKWFCEHCHEETPSVPALCEVCGGQLFENGLDIVEAGRDLPVRARPVILVG